MEIIVNKNSLMSKFEQLEAFIKVVECSGISPAATALHLSASAVTKQIQALESGIGVALFDRTKRSLKLTEIGERYYSEAVVALKNLHQLESLIHTSQKEVSGILKVRCMQFVANSLIIPRLAEFLNLYPKLQFNLESLEHMPNFWQDGVDIVYCTSRPGEDNWIQKKVGVTDTIICVSPGYLEQFGNPKTLQDLQEHRFLTHTSRKPDHLIRLKAQNLIVSPYLWFNSYESMITAAVAGLGFMWVHKSSVRKELESKSLVELFPEHALRDQPTYLYYMSGQYIHPKIRAFVDFFGK
ncbi:MAG: hypothetical protein K0R14_1809 [Burkholderiales bacterium]|jgi:LysR family transcriptional regulator for bpeEF and oprC|nr:hypothetical protein [Burkholderiales bacterium]